MKLLFEKSVPERRGVCLGTSDVPTSININDDLLRDRSAELPELSELDVVRHFTELSRRNFGVDTNFYPLGSCTMKYNPKVAERIASYPGFAHLHPLLPQLRIGGMLTQGALSDSIRHGHAAPRDHRHGRLYHAADGRRARRADRHYDDGGVSPVTRATKKALCSLPTVPTAPIPPVPPSQAIRVKTRCPATRDGRDVDLKALMKEMLTDDVGGADADVSEYAGAVQSACQARFAISIHSVDGLAYYDGANLNAIVGKVRPGDLGL